MCFLTFAVLSFSRSTRPIDPYAHWSSAAGKPAAGLLFQLFSTPLFRIPCGCALAFRKPRHSCWPWPSVGRPASTLAGRSGSRPVVICATCLLSA